MKLQLLLEMTRKTWPSAQEQAARLRQLCPGPEYRVIVRTRRLGSSRAARAQDLRTYLIRVYRVNG